MRELIKRWIRPEISALSAYHVADSSGLIKLDAMENPYVWPDDLRAKWAEQIKQTDVNRYPHPQAPALTQKIKQNMQVPADMAVLLGNGSDEIIQMIAMALASPGQTLLSVEPGFVMYKMIAAFCNMTYVGVPLNADDFSLDMPAMLQTITQSQPAVIFLAYPNNPTGNLFAEADVLEIIAAAPGLVVIDEAYTPFAKSSFMPRLGEFDNLLVMRTVSKMGLAGLRLGLLAGSPEWLQEFDKVRMPYNINVLTQFTAEFALNHQALFDEQTEAIKQQRAKLLVALNQIDALQVFPSQANFILVRTQPGHAVLLFEHVKQQGVLVKLMHGSHPLMHDCLRLTVGTPAENEQLLLALA